MKVAVCFFGIPRSTQECFPSIRDNILSAAPGTAEVKCFYHFYKLSHVCSARSGENAALDPSHYDAFAGFEGDLEYPDTCLERWHFAELQSYGDGYDNNWGSIRNLVHQLNSLHRVTDLVSQWEPDCVAFVRPDLLYHDRWDTGEFERCALNPKLVILPNWQPWGGENDRFSICGRRSYRAYGQRIEQALDFCRSESRPLRAEPLLGYALRKAGSSIRYVGWTASRVRVGGRLVTESFRPERPRSRLAEVRRIAGRFVRRFSSKRTH